MDRFSFKSFENVRLKATYNIETSSGIITKGETVALFDQIQIAGFSDINEHITANGGFDNRPHVFWDTTREERITFSQGVFNSAEFALLLNSDRLYKSEEECVVITTREQHESDELGNFTLNHEPFDNIFVYTTQGKRIEYTYTNQTIHIAENFTDVIVDYCYCYRNDTSIFKLGSSYYNGFLELEGLTRVKDDETGQVVTGILHIPKLKLVSDLSMRLGKQANPVVANFSAVGIPVGSRGNTYVSEFYLLSDDILSDL